MEKHLKLMDSISDSLFKQLKRVDPLRIIDSLEEEDARTAKLVDDMAAKDAMDGKIFLNYKTELLKSAKLEFLKLLLK